jgi:integrase
MPVRLPVPWFRKGRRMWFATIDGVQVSLEVSGEENRDQAVEKLRLLLDAARKPQQNVSAQADSHAPAPAHAPTPTGPTLGEAVAAFLERTARRVKPHTLVGYRQFLDRLTEAIPASTPVRDLTADLVERVCDRPTWSSSTRHDAIGVYGVLLRDAGHPLRLRRPPKESRGADAVWTQQEFWQVYGAALGDFKPLLLVLRDTGCRPSEAASLTVENVDWQHSLCRLKQHKNAAKGKSRVLHFPAPVLAVLQAQRAKYQAGALFRQDDGRPFRGQTICYRVIHARERAGVTRPVTAYGLRHWYATRALEGGMSNEQVAALIGNSAAMIEKHYGHIAANAKLMAELAARVAG